MLALPLLATPAMAQSAGQNILRNGDFTDGLVGWTAGVLRASEYAGYPSWGILGTVGASGSGLSAYLDVSGGAAAYLQSDPFMLPQETNAWTLNATFWGTQSPTVLQVQIITQGGIYTLDSLEPPRDQLDQQPVVNDYRLPANFSGQDIALRFTCIDGPPAHANGADCALADLAVSTPPAANLYAAYAMITAGLGLAAASVALAHGTASGASGGSSGAQGQAGAGAKAGFHLPAIVRSLALALVGYLSKKYCCVCAGKCNHTGPHSFCPAHDPTTLAARMEAVYKVYCRYCGRKLEEHECKGPITEPEENLFPRTMERLNRQNREGLS